MSNSDIEPVFHVVMALRCDADIWSIQGVFTKPEDAAQLVEQFARPNFVKGSVVVDKLTREQIADAFLEERTASLRGCRIIVDVPMSTGRGSPAIKVSGSRRPN